MTTGSDEEYNRLTAGLPPRPIRTSEEARVVESRIAEFVANDSLSDAERDYLEVLSDQLVDWEDSNEEIPDVVGVELIRFLIDEHGLRQKDLMPVFGTESITSEVLAGRRELQRKHIEALSSFFHVSPSAFFPREPIEPTTTDPAIRGGSVGDSRRVLTDERHARRLSVQFDGWAPAAVDYARGFTPMDVTVVDSHLSIKEMAKKAKRENAVLCTFRTASASVLRLTEIGQVVLLASKEFGASTQTKLFERVSFLLLNQNQSAAGLPSHERIVLGRDRIDLERFNSGSRVHTETISFSLGTA